MGEPITSVQWMHSCYECRENIAFLTVKEKHVTIDSETNQILSVKSKLRQYTDPTRKVWITKPEYRKHKYKKESEELRKCDVYEIIDRRLVEELKELLKGILPDKELYSGWLTKKKLCSSPYVYGTDISVEALMRYRYESKQTHVVTPITIGSLDIESSVIHDDHRTNCITVVCDKKIYTAALQEFMWKDGSHKEKAKVDDFLDMLYNTLESHLGKLWTDNDFEVEAKVFKTEKELYDFIFAAIKRDQPDFMFIWNIGYDVPQIVSRLSDLFLDPKDYFCSDNIPKTNRYLRYYEDRKKVSHIVQKWNWLHCTSETQWLDGMALYGQVNKQKPKESSYSLSDIMEKILGVRKLDLEGHSHEYMQKNEFVRYWVYNVIDALLVQLGTWKNQNHISLHQLTAHSTLMDFSKQTVMLCNDYHHVLLEDGRVFASTGTSMTGPYDHLIGKVGGAVLDAKNVDDIGICCVVERPNDTTNVLLYGADSDYEALYPNWKIACAIAKENKKATLVGVDGKNGAELEALSSALSDPKENAVWIGSKFFNLPDYSQMECYVRNALRKRGDADKVPF